MSLILINATLVNKPNCLNQIVLSVPQQIYENLWRDIILKNPNFLGWKSQIGNLKIIEIDE
jgi:hypothetical protein